jgi:hypothetical protein
METSVELTPARVTYELRDSYGNLLKVADAIAIDLSRGLVKLQPEDHVWLCEYGGSVEYTVHTTAGDEVRCAAAPQWTRPLW